MKKAKSMVKRLSAKKFKYAKIHDKYYKTIKYYS